MKATEDRSRTHKHQAEFGLVRQTDIWHFPTSEDLIFQLKKKYEFQACVANVFFNESLLCSHAATSSSSVGHQYCLLVIATQKPAAGETRRTFSATSHLIASGENWWKRGWRGLLEWGKGGSFSQPPFFREQLQHPCHLSCCAGYSGATGTPALACGASKMPQLP